MSYELAPDEALPEAVRRVAREEAEGALESLSRPGDAPGDAIHDARKRFKKIRAVLRLVRPHLGEPVFDRENVAYRDAGRALAPAREADVAVATLESLGDVFEDAATRDAFEALRSRLRDHRHAALARATGPDGAVQRARDQTEEALGRIDRWPLEGLDLAGIIAGLRQVYARGRRAMTGAYEVGTGPAFHEWRKRVKYLWYHLLLLTPTWPPVFGPLADAQHQLAALLGEANDFADLLTALREEGGVGPVSDEVADALRTLASRRQASLWERAEPLGHRIYAEDPADFVARVERYWEGMRMEERVD